MYHSIVITNCHFNIGSNICIGYNAVSEIVVGANIVV